MKIKIFNSADGENRLYVIRDEKGVTFIILCDKNNTSGFFTLIDTNARLLGIALGVPHQGFTAAENDTMFAVEKGETELEPGSKSITITNPHEELLRINLFKNEVRKLKIFLEAV
jgi:hypothetical protein